MAKPKDEDIMSEYFRWKGMAADKIPRTIIPQVDENGNENPIDSYLASNYQTLKNYINRPKSKVNPLKIYLTDSPGGWYRPTDFR